MAELPDHAPILHTGLPYKPWLEPLTLRLPGLWPVEPNDWLNVDEVFAEQMALRDHLFATQSQVCFAETPGSSDAQQELLDTVITTCLTSGRYGRHGSIIERPDGVRIDTSSRPALLAAAHLVQEDLLLLQKTDDRHILKAGALAFPAHWTLSEKIGRPMSEIHQPVRRIDNQMDQRIERLFDRLPPGRPVQRANALAYNSPLLHQPAPEAATRAFDPELPVYIRVERQCLTRLPHTSAIAFSIHTYIARKETLSITETTSFDAYFRSIA